MSAQLHERFASDLRVVIGQKERSEKSTLSPLRGLFSDALGGTARLKNLPGSRSIHFLGMREQKTLHLLTDLDKGSFSSLAQASDNYGSKFFTSEGVNFSKHPDFDPLDYIFLFATLAAINMPEGGYSGGKVGKPKGETLRHQIFRRAIGKLRDMESKEVPYQLLRTQDKKGAKAEALNKRMYRASRTQQRALAAELMRAATELFQANTDVIAYSDPRTFARIFLAGLVNASFTADKARTELAKASESYKEYQEKQDQWVFLPPQPTPREVQIFPSPEKSLRSISRRLGIHGLWDLVNQWGEGHVAETRFKTGIFNRYNVAILPQILPDGTAVEHAVLEDPKSGAIYVWRAENGISDGIIEKTWVDVFDHRYKLEAQADRAKKITHHSGWEEKLEEYLSCPQEKLAEHFI